MGENTSEKKPSFLDPKANLKGLVRIGIIVVILLAGVWLLIRFTAGQKAANMTAAALLQRPMELKNSIENLPATSFKAIGVSLPYTGTLNVDVSVLKGNEIDVYVVEENQLENIKNNKSFSHIAAFEATKTKIFKRSARLKSGGYYVVFMDKTLGILSASSTDVQVKVNLEP